MTSHAEMLYLSTVRLVNKKGKNLEVASAFAVVDENDERFLVTARHAVEGAERTTVHLYTGTNVHDIGRPLMYEIHAKDNFWIFHPDDDVDVAVGRFEPIADFFEKDGSPFVLGGIQVNYFQPKPEPGVGSFTDKFWHPLPLDEVLIIGYPSGYGDTPTSLPVLRRGRIATPLWLDHESRPVFLVDTTSTHGTSGGPVAYVEEEHHVGKTMYDGTGKVILLGVFTECLPPKASASPSQTPPNLGAAYKAHTILETLRAIT